MPTDLRMPALTLTVGLSALLLFGMEPLVGRLVIPFFGGAVHVWLTCLMFFQAALFLGYLYAHVVSWRIGPWHLLILALPVLVLPLGVESEVAPESPLWVLVGVLIRYIALPFFALSTTAVVLQAWLARSELGKEREPYPLYAASNVGSLVALLGYPFFVEPLLGLTAQRYLWTVGYVVYAGLVVACYYLVKPSTGESVQAPPTSQAAQAPTAHDVGWWLVLSAVPSAFLLATTNVVASEVGSFPLVWVVPLALYLGTFIWTFREGDRPAVPALIGGSWPELLILGGLAYILGPYFFVVVVLQLVILLVFAWIAHGELYARRPHPQYLTHFYLVMSLGGWIGGAVVTFLAPVLFSSLLEYPLLLAAFGALFVALRREQLQEWFRDAPLWAGGSRMGLLMIMGAITATGVYADTLLGNLARYRTFYGTYRIAEAPYEDTGLRVRSLYHGLTLHGAELLEGEGAGRPMSYYHPTQCLAMTQRVASPQKQAIIGLGAGVAAAYNRPDGVLHYYEIDGRNEEIAREWFGYLDAADGAVEVRVGDGRLRLDQSSDTYDLIWLDAFSGDGIPAHLMTDDALGVYLDHLAPDGLLLYHISNRYYALHPILHRQFSGRNLAALQNPETDEEPAFAMKADCVVVARSEEALKRLADEGWVPLDHNEIPDAALWTDDYVNVLAALRYRLVMGL